MSSTVANGGKVRAGASSEGFGLSRTRNQGGFDVPLRATASVKPVKARARAKGTAAVSLPAATPSGTYFLVACANSDHRVRESNTRNNCRASRRAVRVNGAVGSGAVASLPGLPSSSSLAAGGANPGSTGSPGSTPSPLPKTSLPPDPASVAPPLSASGVTPFADSTSFLYSGDHPIQTGVAKDAITLERAGVMRGQVGTRDGSALSGVKVEVLDHPELGQTLSRADGRFDIAVNGGDAVTLRFTRDGYLPATRRVVVPWNRFVEVPKLVMIATDSKVTHIDLSAAGAQAAQSSTVTDDRGARTNTLLLPPGTQASALSHGARKASAQGSLDVRASEFTVGATGPAAMPAPLPPNTAYTYAVDLSADGLAGVSFNHPVYDYVDNFLKMKVGTVIPNGALDLQSGRWVGDNDGVVVKILSENGGSAQIDSTGSGNPDSQADLDKLGFTAAELQRLATTFPAGAQLWRMPITHFSPHDFNFYSDPPSKRPPAPPPPRSDKPPGKPCDPPSIACETQTLFHDVPVTGTPFSLHYDTARVPGNLAANTITIPVTGSQPAPEVEEIDVAVDVAGEHFERTFPGQIADQAWSFTWDGKDAYGRALTGTTTAHVALSFIGGTGYCTPTFSGSSWTQYCPRLRSGAVGVVRSCSSPTRTSMTTTSRWAATTPAASASAAGTSTSTTPTTRTGACSFRAAAAIRATAPTSAR